MALGLPVNLLRVIAYGAANSYINEIRNLSRLSQPSNQAGAGSAA